MYDELSLYKKGTAFNNGILDRYCQYRLGDMYANGDGGVFKDAVIAQQWAEIQQRNQELQYQLQQNTL